MPVPGVIEKVRQLHAELGDTQPNPATQPELDSLKAAVATVMLEPDHAPHYTSLKDRLLFAYVGFEIDHPKLAEAMQQVMVALNAAGL